MDRISPGVIAVIIGLACCFALVTPWVSRRHRSRGEITLADTTSAITTSIAVIALVTYTLMPLPAPWSMTCTRPAGVQLVPFAFVADAVARPSALVQVAFNVALFAPVGFLIARRLRRRPVLLTTLLGAAVSLAIELTQLTAVWGLWPCAFRVFDADDLVANTAGALVGAVVARAVRTTGRQVAGAHVPRPLTVPRRLTGMLCDACILVLGGWAASGLAAAVVVAVRMNPWDRPAIALGTAATVVPALVFSAVALVERRTPGERAVRLRADHSPSSGWMTVRLVLGPVGWSLLSAPPTEMPWTALVFAAASVTAVACTPGRVGLACWAAGIRMVDDRIPEEPQHGAAPRRTARRVGGLVAAAVVVAVALPPLVAGANPRFGAADVYTVPARFADAYRDAAPAMPGSPLRGVVLDRGLGTDVLRGDLSTVVDLTAWLLLKRSY